MIVFKI